MDQKLLCDALKKMAELADQAQKSGKFEAKSGDIGIKLNSQWRGIDRCKWLDCKGEAYQTSWTASRGGVSVDIWEMMFHFAKMNHWISFSEISEEDQAKLAEIFA